NGGNGRGAPGAIISLYDTSKAENATLVANSGTDGGQGGAIHLSEESRGDKARVELSSRTILSIDFHNAPGITLGSIEGNGRVTLGANNLTVGENNLDTTFSG